MESLCFRFILIASSLVAITAAKSIELQDQKLIVLMLDSLRHDFLKPPRISQFPNLKRLVQEGSRADRIIPVFPSLTLPNFYSLLSGVYTEEHSFTHNNLYDSSTGKKFVGNFQGDDLDPQWWAQETIIDTAAKQGKKVYAYNVPMCRSPPAVSCELHTDLNSLSNFGENVHKATEALQGDADAAVIYVGQPDLTMHTLGVEDPRVVATIAAIDGVIGSLMESVRDDVKLNKLNIMIVSDHGHITILKDKFTYWGSAIDRADSDEIVYNAGIALQIWPKQGQENKVIKKLKASNAPIKVYRRREIPEDWHMKRGKWVPPVYVTADYGNVFIENDTAVAAGDGVLMGFHGYHVDQADMSGVCLGWGPAFKKGYSHKAVKATDIYQIFTTILNVTPHPHRGSFSRVRGMFASSRAVSLESNLGIFFAIVFTFFIF